MNKRPPPPSPSKGPSSRRQPSPHQPANSLSYRDAGVDIDQAARFVERIKPLAQRTRTAGVVSGLGGFGGLFSLGDALSRAGEKDPSHRLSDPLLVASTDGVGTKLRLAIEAKAHRNVGVDLVAMCVNDILAQGATPLFFLDYLATAKLDIDVAVQVVEGICDGCAQAGAALLGGETAEMPGMYAAADYDLAGFAVGMVDRGDLITGQSAAPGHILLGLGSSGPHANGYSLIRKVLEINGLRVDDPQVRIGRSTLAEHLLSPTRIYVASVLPILSRFRVHAIAHITGGGLMENIPRVLPEHTRARIDPDAWEQPEIFHWLASHGGITAKEMYRTFNCGIGLVLVVEPEQATQISDALRNTGETVHAIGTVEASDDPEPKVVLE